MPEINQVSIANSQGVYFPRLYSPFSDRTLEDVLYCDCKKEYQCFLSSDFLRFQVQSFGANPFVTVNGDVYNPVTSFDNKFNFNIPLVLYENGLINVQLFKSGFGSNTLIDETGLMKVIAPEDDCRTLLLEWRSECEAQGVDYTISDTFLNCLRVPMRFFRPAPNDNEVLNQTKGPDGRYRVCSSDLDELWTFAVAGIPDWMHQVIRKAYLNTTFRINGVDFVRGTSFRKTERRCCNYLGEGSFIPKDSDNAADNCCIGEPFEFVAKPIAQINCDATPTVSDFVIDTRNSTDSDGNPITSGNADIRYLYDFGGKYIAEISGNLDPTLPASWSLLFSPNGDVTSFNTDVVGNISLPAGGFAGYFEISDDFLVDCGLQNASISIVIVDDDIASSNAVCVISADESASLECPIPSLLSSDLTDNENVQITNQGSTESIGGTPIENNPDYSFSHAYAPGMCGGGPAINLFTVSGIGGSTSLSFTGWHPSINGTAQALIMAEFSGGMGLTGYTFDKTAVIQHMLDIGFNPGGTWCLTSTVTNTNTTTGPCTDSTQLQLNGELVLFQHAYITNGVTPTSQSNTTLSHFSATENGSFNSATPGVSTEIPFTLWRVEASLSPNIADGSLTTTNTLSGYSNAFDFINDEKVFYGVLAGYASGLETYTSLYQQWDATQSSFVRARFQAQPPIGQSGTGTTVRSILDIGGVGGISGETFLSSTQQVERFPVGGGGIVLSGNDDPCAGTADPVTANIAAGGTPHPFTVNPGDGGSIIVTGLVEGTYYVKIRYVTSGGLIIENIAAFTMLEI